LHTLLALGNGHVEAVCQYEMIYTRISMNK